MSRNEARREQGPDESEDFDEDDYYDEEYEDFFDETDEKPLAVDELIRIQSDQHRSILDDTDEVEAD